METNNMLSFCRTCLKISENMVSIYTDNLKTSLVEHAGLHINDDDTKLPQMICHECHALIVDFVTFKITSQQVEQFLNDCVRTRLIDECTANIQSLIDAYFKEKPLRRRYAQTNSNPHPHPLHGDVKVECEPNEPSNSCSVVPESDITVKPEILRVINPFESTANGISDDGLDGFGAVSFSLSDKEDASENEPIKNHSVDVICNKCGKSFPTKRQLNCHQACHSKNRNFKCTKCKKTFKRQDHLDRHLLRHNSKPTHTCELCSNKYFELSALVAHCVRKHKLIADIKCSLCSEHFVLERQLAKHMKLHDMGFKTCRICDKQCVYINRHMMRVHKTALAKSLKCSKCNRVFATEKKFRLHEARESCDGKAKYPRNLNVCHVCGKEFINADHILTHSDIKPFPCEICNKSFASVTFLRSHKRAVHRADVSCNICGRLVKRKNLNRHVNNIHKHIRSHECTLCAKTFTTNSHLKYHMRMHTDERPHQCDLCPKTFRHKRTMTRHRLIHTGEKPFACELCPKAFNQQGSLKLHMKTHRTTESTNGKVTKSKGRSKQIDGNVTEDDANALTTVQLTQIWSESAVEKHEIN